MSGKKTLAGKMTSCMIKLNRKGMLN